jgi:hypothetical protein
MISFLGRTFSKAQQLVEHSQICQEQGQERHFRIVFVYHPRELSKAVLKCISPRDNPILNLIRD